MCGRRAPAVRKLDGVVKEAGSIDDAIGEGRWGRLESGRAEGRRRRLEAPIRGGCQAAVDDVVERMRPGQIILFGSGAREEMSAGSDLDLLVVAGGGGGAAHAHERWRCERTGQRLDVLVRDRSTVEARRRHGAAVESAALEEGRTIYLDENADEVATGPEWLEDGAMMVKNTLFVPDKALEFLRKAQDKYRWSQDAAALMTVRCEMLQASLEMALKAVISARGMRVPHTHELNELWERAEEGGVRLNAAREPGKLDRLTFYAGLWSYDAPGDEDPDETCAGMTGAVEAVLDRAQDLVPGLMEETERKLKKLPPGYR